MCCKLYSFDILKHDDIYVLFSNFKLTERGGFFSKRDPSWKVKRPQIQLHPQHFLTYSSNLTTVVNSVPKCMINEMTSTLKSYIFQICAAIYQLLLHMVFTSRNLFVMQRLVAIILISWNVTFIWETGYWTRAMKRFALIFILKRIYYDTKSVKKYIASLQRRC